MTARLFDASDTNGQSLCNLRANSKKELVIEVIDLEEVPEDEIQDMPTIAFPEDQTDTAYNSRNSGKLQERKIPRAERQPCTSLDISSPSGRCSSFVLPERRLCQSEDNNHLCRTLSKSAIVPMLNLRTDLSFRKVIGEGAFGTVELHEMQNKNGVEIAVAVKKLKETVEIPVLNNHFSPVVEVRSEFMPMEEVRSTHLEVEEFTREVRLQAQMKHPNIVRVLGMGSYVSPDAGGELPFMVQELMDRSLTDALRTKYTMKTGLGWCLNVAEALKYMHESTPVLIHRDLKPDNILLDKASVAKVADLGLFASLQRENQRKRRASTASINLPSPTTLSKNFFFKGSGRPSLDKQSPSGGSSPARGSSRSPARGSPARGVGRNEISPRKKKRYSFTLGLSPGKNNSDGRKRRNSLTDNFLSTFIGLNVAQLSFLDPATMNKLDRKLLTGKTGTLRYMAPENYRGDPYTEKVDQYSFAMLMYAVLNHGEPYDDDPRFVPDQIAASAAQEGGMRPKLRKRWPEPVKELITECWDFHPEKRPSFKDIVDRLTTILEDKDLMVLVDTIDQASQGCQCIIC